MFRPYRAPQMNSSDKFGTLAVPALDIHKLSKIAAGHQSVAHGAGNFDRIRRVGMHTD
jgi:hypothetical protein